jgi:outer membrane protein OmpA-like peptidoglycan-associated protein
MKYIITLLATFILNKLPAQSLIANGSFEEENICTEYQQHCAPEAWIATSLWSNYFFDSTMRFAVPGSHGTHFVGLIAGNITRPGMRNFIRTQLLCGLQPGHQYQLSFYTRANNPILDSIGVYFSSYDFLAEGRSFRFITPQLWSTDVINRSIPPAQWQKLTFTYTANGTESFLTIGNFKRTDYKGIRRGDLRFDYMFFIDSVSFTPLSPTERMCPDAARVRQEIYADNYRHNYLEKKVYYMRRIAPVTISLQKTTQQRQQRIDTLVIPDIFFASGSAVLANASFSMLDSFANSLATFTIDSMVIEGHTDSIGKLAYNEALSLHRAHSVRDYVAARVNNLHNNTIARGLAFHKPVASNKTPRGRQQNRRVEIFVYRRE